MDRRHNASRWQSIVMVLALGAGSTMAGAVTQKFFPDDPLTSDPENSDASHVKPQIVGPGYIGWQIIRDTADHTWRRAINVNVLDEVPDSSWFTNRFEFRSPSANAIERDFGRAAEPPHGPWTVVAGKSNGVMPGLQLKDSTGQRYFVKFDPPSNPEMASGAEVISTWILHAVGYNVPDNQLATLRRDDVVIGEGATFKGPDGRKRSLTLADLDQVLHQAARRPDGSYRILASRALDGIAVGPFKYEGTRPDDPNDIVPHEHRRELRGLRVFAAWLNHVDTKAENSLDTLIAVGPRTIVRHHLIDFGSTLGSGGVEPMGRRDGYEYALDKRATILGLASLGLYVPPWQRIRYPHLPSVGRIDADHFRPERWKPTLPNPAFQNARPDDTFWAARRVMAFTDEAIAAIVRTAQFSDPQAAAYLSNVLIRRRDAIGRTWLTAVNPIVDPSVTDAGIMTFRNAVTDAGLTTEPSEYWVSWATYDNTTGAATPVGHAEGCAEAQCPLPANVTPETQYLRAEIRTVNSAYPAWSTPVHVFLRRDDDHRWSAVGLERLLEDSQSNDERRFANRRNRRTPSSDAGE
jgi:hypothetical protein